jgi:hypothetical protein
LSSEPPSWHRAGFIDVSTLKRTFPTSVEAGTTPTCGSAIPGGKAIFSESGRDFPEDLKTHFALEQRSYQGSLYRDLADHLQGGVYAGFTNSHSPAARLMAIHRSARTFRARRISRLGNGFPVSFPTQRSCRMAASSYTTLATTPDGLTRGINIYARAASDDGLNNHAAFADYGWIEGRG